MIKDDIFFLVHKSCLIEHDFFRASVMEASRSTTIFITITFIFTSFGIMSCFLSLLFKLSKGLPIPKLWKYSICLLDSSALFLGIGLIIHLVVLIQQGTAPRFLILASASLMLFGYMDGLCSFLTFQTILLFVQNPRKVTSTTNYQLGSSIIVFTGIKLACLLLSVLPVIPNGDYFNVTFYSLLPLHWPEEHGGTYSVLLVICFWLVIFATFAFSIIGMIKSQRFTSLVNSATEDVWQISAIGQGRLLHQLLLFQQFVYMIVSILITKVLFRSRHQHELDNVDRHVAMVTISLHILIHGIVSNTENVVWTKNTCCRNQNGVSQDSRRLKRLELLRMEHPGKFHFLASWIDNKKDLKTGMMKVYNTEWLKLWAQEIMVLGVLRKVKHPNLLQCLWTSNNNPYYEIVTLLSEDIVSSESRIICLEFPEYGCLREYLKKMELPMTVSSQCMITSDVAQGLNQLHKLDILHRNLSSIRVYLRLNNGNNPCLRAALGDFEYVTIFGSPLQGADNPQCKNRQNFLLPDIRSFALITLEMVLAVCNKSLQIPKLSSHPEVTSLTPDLENNETLHHNYHQKQHHQNLQPNEIKQNIDFHNSTSNEKIMYVKNKIGYFPAASEESIYQKWTDLNPESLNDTLKNKSKQEENKDHEQNGRTIFVAPAMKENHTSKFSTEGLKVSNTSENGDSACSEISMLVEVEKDSESEVSPAEADELLCHYKVRRQSSKANRSLQSQISTESDPYKYHWSSFVQKSDYSDLELSETDQSFQNLPFNEREQTEKRDNMAKSERTEQVKQTETRHPNVSGGFQDKDELDNSLHRRLNIAIQKKHKARKNLQKTLTSRVMPFKHQPFVLPSRQNRESFKPRTMNIIVNDRPTQFSTAQPINRKSPTCKKSFSQFYNEDIETYASPDLTSDKFVNKRSESVSSYGSGDNSILCVSDVSYPASSSYTQDISSLSSATDALTKNILQEDENLRVLYHKIHSADDSFKKFSDSGFETESTPSNGTNNTERQPMLTTHSRKLKEMASFVPLIENLPGSVDNQFISQGNCGIWKRKVDHLPNKETNIYSSFPCKKIDVNSSGNHNSEKNEDFTNPSYKKTNQHPCLNKIASPSPNVASERYRELQRRGVPLKISIVSSNLQNGSNQISKLSPNISTNSEKVNKSGSDSTNNFLPNQKLMLHSCGEENKIDVQAISESPNIKRENSFTASVEGSPLFTTKVLGRPCPPTPTSVMPHVNFSSMGRPVLESRISCDDFPDYSAFGKSSMRRISLQNQDGVFVPSRQLSRLNSASLSHSSSLSHLSLPGKSIVDKYKLLPGVDEHQLGYCLDLVEKQPFICIEDLLPATESAFKHLRAKLDSTGELTNAAKQLMDIVVICWYLESPPSTAKLCEQLKDPVMETTV